MFKQPALIIFDCDGVLVDSETISNDIVAQLLTQYGLSMGTDEAIALFAGTSWKYIREYYTSKTKKDLPDNIVEIFREKSVVAFEEKLQPIEGIVDTLKQINLPKCVASNGPMVKIKRNLEITGLDTVLEKAPKFSAYDIQRWKPDPTLYLNAAKFMEVEPAASVVVEDSTAGVQAAIAAGMRVFGFTNGHDSSKLKAAGAMTFDHMSELPSLIEALNN